MVFARPATWPRCAGFRRSSGGVGRRTPGIGRPAAPQIGRVPPDFTGYQVTENPTAPTTPAADPAAITVSLPVATRLGIEIPKPKDWQAFQRNCVLLFRDELRDPHAQEYGRSGQNQAGIDIIGKRDGDPNRYVGIQCRLITKPLKKEKILADCRAALALEAGLKEIIFATTAPHDTRATDAAIEVEQTLRREGHDVTVVVYGWDALQTLIAIHDVPYAAFFPSVVASSARQAPTATPSYPTDLADQVAARIVEQIRQNGLTAPPGDAGATWSAAEDQALHARLIPSGTSSLRRSNCSWRRRVSWSCWRKSRSSTSLGHTSGS